ncbi:lipase member H-B [Harpegnathos saltator]|uniref:lipase member H-B n=1 Tax=Harpegnathos saltator TaxID=610380 RepID=UPI000DBEE5CA|nr:lipase member H-B [Harpegnathos saltator]
MYAIANDGDDLENLESIFLRYYIRKTLDEYIDYSLDNVSSLQTRLNPNRKTVLYIHGYTENLQRESVRTVVQAYLNQDNHNTIALSYAKLANGTYTKVVKNIVQVGAVVALFLDNMEKTGFNTEKLHIVGHSMGAHVASYISRKVNFSVPRITGLDPAGPFFNFLEPHLSYHDARFVDIIHTDYAYYGIAVSTGTVDFFPNGGHRIQPGCPEKIKVFSAADFCSHHRSWEFYAESVTNESSFLGVHCSSWPDFLSGNCNNNTPIFMGYRASRAPNIMEGNVYLKTAAQSPFGLEKKGAQGTVM